MTGSEMDAKHPETRHVSQARLTMAGDGRGDGRRCNLRARHILKSVVY